MHVGIQRDGGETALGEEGHDCLYLGVRCTVKADHVAEEAAGGAAYEGDAIRVGIPPLRVRSEVADRLLHVLHHVWIRGFRSEAVVNGEHGVTSWSEKVDAV